MTTDRLDDSPALGGRSDDNAPMISSVQTRVIADARGAYLAGNLDALITRMSDEQTNSFKHAIVQWAWAQTIGTRAESGEIRLSSPEMHEAGRCIERWLEHPSAGHLQDIEQALETLDWFDEPDQLMFDFVEAIVSIAARTSAFTVDGLPFMEAGISPAHESHLQTIIRQWHLDVAWAILQGRHLPPYPAIDAQTLDLAISDLPYMYQEQNLDALIFAFTEEQALRFRYLMFDKALNAVEKSIPGGPIGKWARDHFATISNWLDDPARPDEATYTHLSNRLLKSPYYPLHAIFLSLRKLSEALNTTSREYRAGHTETAIKHATLAVTYIIAEAASVTGNHSRSSTALVNVYPQVHTWLLNAAWAILHDAPIPPLEPA
jgi:hypothetical protein